VRSMRTPREVASGLRETIPMIAPVLVTAQRGQIAGTIKETQIRANATTRIKR
jgi:hypothetical protein